MSRLRRNHISRTQYSDPVVQPDEMQNLSAEDRELAARIEQRKSANRRNQVRKKRRRVVMLVLIFALLLTMCSREIVRLKAENRALKKQHAQLEQERDRLTKELGRVGDKDYIKEQARKQLRLLDPGEKMFIFEEGEVTSDEEAAAEKSGESSEETEGSEEENNSDE
ncbi:MAG: septum formation initiator family protein [Mogibacterium sp.]|nr:septum formation initiator family protein [Mogibacterium sp.]